MARLPRRFGSHVDFLLCRGWQHLNAASHNPSGITPARYTRSLVWPLPRSLATTRGVSVDFFSSGYLDVSVPRVASLHLWIQCRVRGHNPSWVSPFGNPRIKGYVLLPVAYRSLSRPSSFSCAKASTVCPYRLPCPCGIDTGGRWCKADDCSSARCDLLRPQMRSGFS